MIAPMISTPTTAIQAMGKGRVFTSFSLNNVSTRPV